MAEYIFRNVSIYPGMGQEVFHDMQLETKGNRISYLGAKREAEGAVIDGNGGILMPGLINAHTHLPMTLFRGVGEGRNLSDWLQQIFALEDQLNGELAHAAALFSMLEMIQTGTTGLMDMYFFSDALAEAVCQSGLRGTLCRCVTGQTLEEARPRLQEAEQLYRTWNGAENGRISIDFSLHAEYTCGRPVMRACRDLAEKHDASIQVHISETKSEHEACKERHGKTPTQTLKEEGVFDRKVIGAHCVWLEEEDMDIFREKGAIVAHCPKSNLKLGSGIANIPRLLQHGIPIALGTDGAASNNRLDLYEEMRFLSLLPKGEFHNPEFLSPEEAIAIATANGAKAMGIDAGKLAPGMLADMVLIAGDNFLPKEQALSHIVYLGSGADIRMNMVDGKILYRDGEYLSLDQEKIVADFRQALKKIRP